MGEGERAKILARTRNRPRERAMRGPMEAIVLSFRGEPLRVFPVQKRPLEVGSGPGCDVVVHDAEVAPRAWLVQEGPDGVLAVLIRKKG